MLVRLLWISDGPAPRPLFPAMKTSLCPAVIVVVLALCSIAPLPGQTAPPKPAEEKNVFKRMGGFLLRKTRQLEESQQPPPQAPPPGRSKANRPTPSRRSSSSSSGSGTASNSRPRGETQYLNEAATTPRSRMEGQENGASGSGTGEGAGKPGTKPAGSDEIAGPPAPLIFAVPVPGRAGFVYPPGAEKIEAHMLDVRGLAAGQKARDPRTGKVFLVP